jgi:DNA polymerase III delta prime subunit
MTTYMVHSVEAINKILNRDSIIKDITKILRDFESNCHNLSYKKGIYIYGSPGCGKTTFVKHLLESLNYDMIKYDAGDVRNKSLIDTITCNNVSNRNVLSLMNREKKPIAIVMDEIDEMNNGDKRGITSLIKLIRQKKTKKQKLEHVTMNPIICIGNNYVDKKMKELKKVCNIFELKTPTQEQMTAILDHVTSQGPQMMESTKNMILNFLQGDMRKLLFIENMYHHHPEVLQDPDIIHHIFHIKTYNDDAKKITNRLLNEYVPLEQHNQILNETDRTIISLLYHENLIDMLPMDKLDRRGIPFYNRFLDNLCCSDHIDRITFQNQIWIFNEMSSMIKTFYNNWLYHNTYPENAGRFHPEEVRFTKVLTKYSTEYNNQLFLFNICQEMDMDKKDVISFFQELRMFVGAGALGGMIHNKSGTVEMHDLIENILQSTDINKLDIKRIYRFLDKNSDSFDCIQGRLVNVENSAHTDGFDSGGEDE